MPTYIKLTSTGQYARLDNPPAVVKKMVSTGFLVDCEVVKSTKKLRDSARINVLVRCLTVLDDGKLAYL